MIELEESFFKHIIMTLNYGLTRGGIMLKLFDKDRELNLQFSKKIISWNKCGL